MPARLCWVTLAIVLLGISAGCSSKPSNLVKVSGIVTLDGAPLDGAKVTFYPSSGDAPPSAVTDSAGRFQLETFDMKTLKSSEGAAPGEYKVTVEIPTPAARNPDNPEAALQAMHMKRGGPAAPKAAPPKEAKVVHPNYTDVSKTPLKQVVPPQGPVELKLTKNGT